MTAGTAAGPPEQLVDLQGLLAGLRWRRRVWAGLALTGFLIGLLSAVLAPAGSSASTAVYVVRANDSSSTSQTAMATDIAVLQTSSIATAAQERLGSVDGPSARLGGYSGDATSGNVLTITATGPDDRSAVATAQAVADAFVADHVARTGILVDSRVALLRQQLEQTQDQLAALPPSAPDDGADGTGPARRADLENRVRTIAAQIQAQGLGSPEVAAGTRIIDVPRATTQSPVVAVSRNSLIGLILGLGAGIALAAVMTVVADRPVLRRDIAAQLGASVVAQLGNARRGLGRFRPRSSADRERRRVASTVARLSGRGSSSVALLELGCPDVAAELGLDVARELSAQRRVRIVDDVPRRSRLELPADLTESSVELVDVEVDPPTGDVTRLGLGTLRAGTAWTDLGRFGAEAVLIVRTGHASAAWLHTVARQLGDAEILVLGVVLVNPDPRDRTDGTLWSEMHTALRGRAGVEETQPSASARPTRDTDEMRRQTAARVANGAVRSAVDSRATAGAVATESIAPSDPRPSPAPRQSARAEAPTERLRPVAPGGTRNFEKGHS